jgi:hypothetical protein
MSAPNHGVDVCHTNRGCAVDVTREVDRHTLTPLDG